VEEKREFIWPFIGRLYSIFAGQFFVSTCIATLFFKLHRMLDFFQKHTVISSGTYIAVLLTVPVGKSYICSSSS
jgi:hypothetical protein